MYWRLHPTLYACVASDRLILLDIERDRYSAVPREVAGPAIAWLRARDGSCAPDAFAALLGMHDGSSAFRNEQPHQLTAPSVATPQSSRRHASPWSILSVFVAVAATWLALRITRLGGILQRRGKARTVGPRVEDAVLRDQAQTFLDARRWCPIKSNCLLDSLAFDRWLGSPSDVRLVFGVLGQPFEAHCWVQSDVHILNDSYDRVSRFEPILSV
ncbi:lasso peptide biosynthesis B2 protein [Sphingomonas sp. PB4P5]|uniref:lasso peptide biosynthesis B2 protein n=1 Tax=Parasphingomonas puruogangriensis TaxID=3096155 RepID=UPI003FA7696E